MRNEAGTGGVSPRSSQKRPPPPPLGGCNPPPGTVFRFEYLMQPDSRTYLIVWRSHFMECLAAAPGHGHGLAPPPGISLNGERHNIKKNSRGGVGWRPKADIFRGGRQPPHVHPGQTRPVPSRLHIPHIPYYSFF